MVTATRIKAAWAVVLTSSNDYIKGVIALKHALHDLHKSEYPLLVLYTPSVSPEVIKTLIDIGCVVKPIAPIHPMGRVEYKSERFAETWTKLAVWNQEDYDRLVLLDADMLPLRNMDELIHMHLPNKDWVAAAYACVCNPQKIKHYPASWVPENCAYTGRDATACTDPTPIGNKADYFNSGLIVLTPDTSKFDAMVTYLNSISDLNIYPFPDQDFLNEIFKAKWRPISYVYNALKTLQWAHKPMWDVNQVKNVHYILTKPWDIDLQQDLSDLESIYKPLYKLWWNSYLEITQTMSNMKQLNLAISHK